MHASKQPLLLEEDRLISGHILVKVWPTLESSSIDRVQLQYSDEAMSEQPVIIWLVFQSIWQSVPIWWPMWQEGCRTAKHEPFIMTLAGVTVIAIEAGGMWQWEFAENFPLLAQAI